MINPVFYSHPPVMHDRYPNKHTHSLYCNILSYRQEKHRESLKHCCQSNVCFLSRLLLFHHFFNFLGKNVWVYALTCAWVCERERDTERQRETERHFMTKHCVLIFVTVVWDGPLIQNFLLTIILKFSSVLTQPGWWLHMASGVFCASAATHHNITDHCALLKPCSALSLYVNTAKTMASLLPC